MTFISCIVHMQILFQGLRNSGSVNFLQTPVDIAAKADKVFVASPPQLHVIQILQGHPVTWMIKKAIPLFHNYINHICI